MERPFLMTGKLYFMRYFKSLPDYNDNNSQTRFFPSRARTIFFCNLSSIHYTSLFPWRCLHLQSKRLQIDSLWSLYKFVLKQLFYLQFWSSFKKNTTTTTKKIPRPTNASQNWLTWIWSHPFILEPSKNYHAYFIQHIAIHCWSSRTASRQRRTHVGSCARILSGTHSLARLKSIILIFHIYNFMLCCLRTSFNTMTAIISWNWVSAILCASWCHESDSFFVVVESAKTNCLMCYCDEKNARKCDFSGDDCNSQKLHNFWDNDGDVNFWFLLFCSHLSLVCRACTILLRLFITWLKCKNCCWA